LADGGDDVLCRPNLALIEPPLTPPARKMAAM
jgi:hypothetical protein